MIKQSDLALAAWKATERTLDAVVTINKIDYKTTDIASISYDAGGYTGDTFGIGSNYENSVTIKFAHLIEGLKPGMTVWPKIGIKTSNGYEYNSLGLFIVSDDIQMDRNNDETTIRACDQMCLLEGTYTSKLTYPAKMTSVIAEIANLAGVLLNTTDISRLPVQVNLPSAITGQTYRNAIGMIAQFYAGFVTFDRDGKLTIRTIAEPDYTLDPSQYEQGGLTKNEAPYKIGGIQCEVTTTTTDSTGQSTETTNTLQVGATSGSQIKLTNNLMTMDRLTSIWQQLQSLTFYPFSLNWFGNPAIEAGDWLTLQDTKGNKFNVPNNGYTMTFDGSLSAVSKADQTSTSSSSYAWRGELSQYVADLGGRQGASGNYIYGTDTTEPPYGAKFNDIWYKQNGNKVELWTYERQADGTGKWVLTVSDATGEEVKAKVDQVELEAKASTDAAKAASDKADQLAAKYDDTNALANQALDRAIDAQNSAAGLIDDVNKASQNADDAKSIANSVNFKYTTLTDGSTMTIAELENGLAAKLTKDDLSGYATETWTQNQIKVTADGINSTLSSVKTTVDGQTTSLNNLKADSSGFKAQFVTVNDTLGKQTKDIGTLQATNKSLTAGFDSLNADNTVNQHNISQLQLTATSLSNTIENVNQKVEDGLISTNIFRSANDFSRSYWTDTFGYPFTTIQTESRYHDSLIHYQGQGKTPAPYSTIAQQTITDDAMAADTWYTLSFYARGAGDNNTVGKFGVYFYGNGSDQSMSSSDGVEVLGTSDTHCIITLTPYFRRYVITFHTPKDFSGGHSFWARNDLDLNDGSLYCDFWHPKLELGKVASDFSVNPADTATILALSSISQTVDAIQTTVRGKVDNDTYQSKMTQLDNQITTKVSQGDITNENILPYSGYWSDLTGWTLMSWGAADRNLNLIHHNFYHNAVDATLCVGTAMADTAAAGSTKFNVIPNTTYTMTFWGFASSNVKGTNVYVLGRTFASTKDYDYVHNVQTNLIMSASGINKYTATFTTNSDETQAYVRLDNQGSTNGQSSGAYFAELKIERGTVSTPYTRVSSSEVQITSDNINLKVSKDGVVNAVNISPEGISIYGNKLHITAATYIDNAVIKDAMIDTINAEKITTGALDATKVNVINLNANNITTGTLSGANLQINLNTGVVTFQHGRIHNAGNTIDINIDAGYMSVANGSNRVMLKNGEMQFVQPGIYDTSDNPYLRISNTFGGQSTEGAAFIGRKYAVLTNSDNATGNEMFDIGLGTEKFSGIATGYGAGVLNSGWHMTKVGGADRGVVISGGKATSYRQYWSASPSIMVGATQTSTHSGGMNGSNIIMDCDYLYNFSTWMRTSSHAANVYVADDGAIVRASSASKYKTNIERSFETGMGERILEVPTAHWFDKAEVLNKALDSQAPDPRRYFGMIAEDIDDAGLTELVEYNDKGEVEGIMYDRVTLTLIPIIRDYRDRITKLESEVKQLKEG
ncbi:gp58-like family protein [Lactiplantibacillus plantarum]|uniref:gp58-like family protein n=1 Tax=Lactiplantibacillus plantarum TaxID=1590 RepID=UPI00283F0F2A|nr:gp58-like family protein [Lactiplantibacillus plantarum]MDR4071841.1 gp58-like family protein [Lactiplantibacillus plantarum]